MLISEPGGYISRYRGLRSPDLRVRTSGRLGDVGKSPKTLHVGWMWWAPTGQEGGGQKPMCSDQGLKKGVVDMDTANHGC